MHVGHTEFTSSEQLKTDTRSTTSKLSLLLQCLFGNPIEFGDRLTAIASAQADRLRPKLDTSACVDFAELLRVFGSAYGASFDVSGDYLFQIGEKTRTRLQALPQRPFPLFHNAGRNFSALCYLACRALKPTVVIETGTAYGITAAHVLNALSQNGSGHLWSVDLPPLAADAGTYVGSAIPDELRTRWTLIRGASQRVLPRLISQVGAVDIFIHDSLHTYSNMMREFERVWPALAPRGLLIADDIEGNQAFFEFSRRAKPGLCLMVREDMKSSVCGLLAKTRVA